jgi:hypothetical protein
VISRNEADTRLEGGRASGSAALGAKDTHRERLRRRAEQEAERVSSWRSTHRRLPREQIPSNARVKRNLAGRRPIDMLADGSYEEVLDAVERLHAGAT